MTRDLVFEILGLVVVKDRTRQDALGIGFAVARDIQLHILVVAVEGEVVVRPFIIEMQSAGLYAGFALAFVLARPAVEFVKIGRRIKAYGAGVLIDIQVVREALAIGVAFVPVETGLAGVGDDPI